MTCTWHAIYFLHVHAKLYSCMIIAQHAATNKVCLPLLSAHTMIINLPIKTKAGLNQAILQNAWHCGKGMHNHDMVCQKGACHNNYTPR